MDGTAWTALGVVVAVVIGIVTVVIQLFSHRRQNPKRRLNYNYTLIPMVFLKTPASREVTVKVGDKVLAEPYFLTFTIESVSRVDIPSASFDDGKPLEFDLGGAVVHKVIEELNGGVAVNTTEASLQVAPQLIGREATTIVAIIVDGKPRPKPPRKVLLDVDVVEFDRSDGQHLPRWRRKLPGLSESLAFTYFGIFVAGLSFRITGSSSPTSDGLMWMGAVLAVVLFIARTVLETVNTKHR